MLWFRKFAAVVSISVGSALLVLPFPPVLAGERTVQVLNLEVAPAPYTVATARAELGERFVALTSEELAAHPGLQRAFVRLMGEPDTCCVAAGEWRAALEVWPLTATGAVCGFRGILYSISNVTVEGAGPDNEVACFEATPLGALDDPSWSPITRLEAGDLDSYPALAATVAALAAGPETAAGGDDVPAAEWRRFHRRLLDDREHRPSFVVSDRLFTGVLAEKPAKWTAATPWLRPTAQATGGVALAAGLLLLVGTYRTSAGRPGIAVAPVGLALLCDAICLTGGIFFAGVAIDALWVGPLAQTSLVGLGPEWPSSHAITGLHFISLPVMLLALPLLTLFYTSLSAQRIQVDAAGVTSHGALGSTSVSWQAVERVRLREQRNPFAFTVFDFRRLQKVLDLEGATGTLMTINEPSSRRRKRRLLDALRQYAPERITSPIAGLEGTW